MTGIPGEIPSFDDHESELDVHSATRIASLNVTRFNLKASGDDHEHIHESSVKDDSNEKNIRHVYPHNLGYLLDFDSHLQFDYDTTSGENAT